MTRIDTVRQLNPTIANTRPNADDSVRQFVDGYQQAHPRPFGVKWLYDHPRVAQALPWGVATLGAATALPYVCRLPPFAWLADAASLACATLIWRQTPASGTTVATAAAVAVALPAVVGTVYAGPMAGVTIGLGGALVCAAYAARRLKAIVAEPGFDTATYKYKGASMDGGRLYHITSSTGQRLPVLELDGTRPHAAGYAHGVILGAQMHLLWKNCSNFIVGLPDGTEFPETLTKFQALLSEDERDEVRGLAQGFNAWAQRAGVTTRFTPNDALWVQLMPDLCHFRWARAEAQSLWHLRPQAAGAPAAPAEPRGLASPVACTSIFYRGADGGVVLGRNMDWMACGMGGAMSLLMVWKHRSHEASIATVGIPGMIGAVTGWNDRGLTLAMNVVGGETTDVRGIPAALFNRRILRHASGLRDVLSCLGDTADNRPLGPYHLMVGDASSGRRIAFYQGPQGTHDTTDLADAKTLWCLNWSYPNHSNDVFDSPTRQAQLQEYFGAAQTLGPIAASAAAALVTGALQMSTTNGFITLHTVVFGGDKVTTRWSNAFAAQQTPATLPRAAVFSPSQNAR